MNKELRVKIVEMVYRGKDGHIPSAFSIIDIVHVLYDKFIKFRADNPEWEERDYFILSKGHGCLALYVVLEKKGFLNKKAIEMFCMPGGILGEHPDCTKIPGVEASTGSLGHGFPFAVGIALALRIKGKSNKVYVIVGDGECHEGSVWEAANIANNLRLGNMCVIVDWNKSAEQLMPRDALPDKWKAFGWNVRTCDGHDEKELEQALSQLNFSSIGVPNVLIATTVKGKGVPMLEGHGPWHHRIPSAEEYKLITDALK